MAEKQIASREVRAALPAILKGNEAVVITNHGRAVGIVVPLKINCWDDSTRKKGIDAARREFLRALVEAVKR